MAIITKDYSSGINTFDDFNAVLATLPWKQVDGAKMYMRLSVVGAE